MSTESKQVLVAFATRYGSTREVAEAVAAGLSEEGFQVALRPARKAGDWNGYGALVVGAPLYLGSWHKEALRLLAGWQEAARAQPVAVFALGPLHAEAGEREAARAQFRKALDGLGLEPVAAEVFCGKYDPARLRFGDRLLAGLPASPLHGLPAGDARDWTAIRSWARELAGRLR
jgi:menaquinone-dependent protoporphyrinogen oxidase